MIGFFPQSPAAKLKRLERIIEVHKGFHVPNDEKFLWIEKAIQELIKLKLVPTKFKGTQESYFNLMKNTRMKLQKIVDRGIANA